MQDWGGLIGAAYAMRNPERIKRLFFLNTLSGYGRIPFVKTTRWFSFIKKHHDANTLHEVLGNLDTNVLSIMKIIGFENSAVVDRNWIAAYSAPFPTKEDCVGAIEFPLDALLGRVAPYIQEGFPLLKNLQSKPAMLTVGMKDTAIAPETQIADFQAVWPGRPIVKLPNAGHFSQEDEPDTIIALIQQFIQST
jgi:haloalkane dehalogenase